MGAALLAVGMMAPAMGWAEAAKLRTEKPRLALPPRMMWLDNEADPHALASREAVGAVLDKLKETGFNIVVADVRSWHGVSFWNSDVGPRATTIPGKPYPEDFDFLQVLTEEAHKRGLQAHAGMNIFVGGAKAATTGIARKHPEWESVVYDWVTEVRLGDGITTTARGVNDRVAAGVSVFNRAFGPRIFARDSAGNAADGVRGRTAGRWVSDSTTATHWLRLDWPEPVEVDKVVLHFPRGAPPAGVVAWADDGTSVAKSGNAAGTLEMLLGSGTRSVRVEFTDTGAEKMARLDEVEVMTAAGDNVATAALVSADSSLGRGRGRYVVVEDDRVTTVVTEDGLGTRALEIPANGFVAVIDDPAVADPAVGAAASVSSQTRLMRETEHVGGPLIYLNPVDPEVQAHALALIEEVAANYAVDAVTLDRVRFDNFKTDFSDVSRRAFEKAAKVRVEKWPEDIYVPANPWTGAEMAKGPHFDRWVAWRPAVIREFFEKARRIADKHKVLLGDYVGGWYPVYWEVGVNWADEGYDPAKDYDWVPKGYAKTGYAQMLDYLSPGVYYAAVRKDEGSDPDSTIEGGIEIALRVTRSSIPVIPGLYVPNLNSDELFEAAVRQCLEQAGGVMIFSQTTMDKQDRWEAARRGLQATPQLPE